MKTPTFKALLVETDGSLSLRSVGRELKELQDLVGGFLEFLGISDSVVAYIDEEGKRKSLPLNPHADKILKLYDKKLWYGDRIAGPMILIGRIDEDGDETDIPEEEVQRIAKTLEKEVIRD